MGESDVGTFARLTDPAVPEILALAGFDFFVLDAEHMAMDREQLTNIVGAADAAGITPIVRVRENNQAEVLQNLDLDVLGDCNGNAGAGVYAVCSKFAAKVGGRAIQIYFRRHGFSGAWRPG